MFLIVVNAEVQPLIQESLHQYIRDLQDYEHFTEVIQANWIYTSHSDSTEMTHQHASSLKQFLKEMYLNASDTTNAVIHRQLIDWEAFYRAR